MMPFVSNSEARVSKMGGWAYCRTSWLRGRLVCMNHFLLMQGRVSKPLSMIYFGTGGGDGVNAEKGRR